MNGLLNGKVVVVTGPAKGMGADLALVGRDTAAIEPVAAEARAKGRRAEIFPVDLMDAASVEAMGRAVLASFGRCDVLVNIAGGRGPLGQILLGDHAGGIRRDSAAERHRLLPDHARLRAGDDRARLGQDRQCRWHLRAAGDHQIRVEGPRFEEVRATMAKKEGISAEEARRKHASEYALKRISTDQDVANGVLFLATDLSRQTTGQDLAVDGGWVI